MGKLLPLAAQAHFFQRVINARDEFGLAQRLGQIIFSAQAEGLQGIPFRTFGAGSDDDAPEALAAQRGQQVFAGQTRQFERDDEDVRRHFERQLQRGVAVRGRAHLVALRH